MKIKKLTAIFTVILSATISGCSTNESDLQFYDADIIRNSLKPNCCYYDSCFYALSDDMKGIIEYDVKSETVTRAVEFSKYDAFDSDSIPPFFSVIPSGFIVLSYNGAKDYEYYDGDEIKDTVPLYSTVHYLNFKGDEVAKYDIIKGTINEDMSTETDSLFSCFDRGYIYGCYNNTSLMRIDPLTGKREILGDGTDILGISKDGIVAIDHTTDEITLYDRDDITKTQKMSYLKDENSNIGTNELFPNGTVIYETVVTDETAMTSKVTGLYYFRFGEQPEEIPQLSLIADEISMIMSLSDSWYYVKDDVLYAIPSGVEESIKIADNVKWENIYAYNDDYILFNKTDTSADICVVADGSIIHIGE